jgi:hypothetical protein
MCNRPGVNGNVVSAAVTVCGRLAVFACCPVAGLVDGFTPLGWRPPVRVCLRLSFMALHDDTRQAVRDFFLDDPGSPSRAIHLAQDEGHMRIWLVKGT